MTPTESSITSPLIRALNTFCSYSNLDFFDPSFSHSSPLDSIVSMSQNTSPPPYTIRPSETDPLMPLKASRHCRPYNRFISMAAVALLAVTLTSAIFLSVSSLSSCNNPLDPDVRDRIREEWDIERRQHQEEVLKHVDIERRWRVEDNERAHIREQWVRETEEHERKLGEARRRENQEKQAQRYEWEREVERHNREVKERREREAEEHNREVRERREREERERLEMNMMWTDLVPHTCISYGTREYTALLANVPKGYDFRVEACMATPIEIHGVEYKANRCVESGPKDVIGHWTLNQHESDCAPYWSWYKDWGCVSPGSGQRRIEHYLENLPAGADWREFCATTPVSFRGMHFTGAQFCFQKNFGTYGHWVLDDESCK